MPSAATSDELTFTVSSTDTGRAVVTLAGRLDFVAAIGLRERLAHADLHDAPHLVVDLTTVDFVDSAGLAALARDRRDRRLRGAALTLIRPRSDEAMRVFRLTGFDQLFTMIEGRSR